MKIICIGRNYVAHAKELNNQVPSKPLIFMKPETSLFKGEKYRTPKFTVDLHFECEWVLRVGKEARHVAQDQALEYIDGMTLGIDFTARDIQSELKKKGHPWERAKAFDGSALIGEWKDFDDKCRYFKMYKNDALVQDGDINNMIFSPSVLIEEVSRYFTLMPGDMIFTGTPAGVGPVQSGDRLRGELEGEKVFDVELFN